MIFRRECSGLAESGGGIAGDFDDASAGAEGRAKTSPRAVKTAEVPSARGGRCEIVERLFDQWSRSCRNRRQG